jgi:hypothetical protein
LLGSHRQVAEGHMEMTETCRQVQWLLSKGFRKMLPWAEKRTSGTKIDWQLCGCVRTLGKTEDPSIYHCAFTPPGVFIYFHKKDKDKIHCIHIKTYIFLTLQYIIYDFSSITILLLY